MLDLGNLLGGEDNEVKVGNKKEANTTGGGGITLGKGEIDNDEGIINNITINAGAAAGMQGTPTGSAMNGFGYGSAAPATNASLTNSGLPGTSINTAANGLPGGVFGQQPVAPGTPAGVNNLFGGAAGGLPAQLAALNAQQKAAKKKGGDNDMEEFMQLANNFTPMLGKLAGGLGIG